MLNSDSMLLRADKSYAQSRKAFEVQLKIEPFASAELGFKMLSTSAYHFARSLANVGYAIYCIPNMLVAACREDDSIKSFVNGFAAMGMHILAASIDFANIFLTLVMVTIRAVSSLVDKCMTEKTFFEKAGDNISRVHNTYNPFSEAQSDYEHAKSLDFSAPSAAFTI